MIRPFRAAAAVLLLAGLATPAVADGPTFVQNAAPGATDTLTDAGFAQLIAAAGRAEIEQGRMVMERGSNADVRRFAQQMVEDHTAANTKLAPIAESLAIVLPDQPSQEDQATAARLVKLDGTELDRAYIDAQIRAHAKAVSLLRWQIASGTAPALKRFAEEELPVVRGHLEKAEALKSRLTQAARR